MKTFDDVAKALKDGSVNMGISGFGNGPHVIMQAIAEVAGIGEINYVTFDGEWQISDSLSSKFQLGTTSGTGSTERQFIAEVTLARGGGARRHRPCITCGTRRSRSSSPGR